MFLGPFLVAGWALSKLDLHSVKLGLLGWVCLCFGLVAAGFQIRAIVKHGVARRRLLQALIAEQFTAQELNRLVADGCMIFNDLPCEGFNIDHVVIGPSAVYAIETKSRQKPKRDAEGGSHKVAYDGDVLRFPDHLTKKPLDQAARQADWLAREIERVTAQRVLVIPALALPGWWVEYSKTSSTGRVRVFNPAGKGARFMTEGGGARLDPSVRSLVAQCLSMRYPDTPVSLTVAPT
jgi:hypothetical protein